MNYLDAPLEMSKILSHSLSHVLKYGECFNPVGLKKLLFLWIDLFNLLNRSLY